MRNKFCTLFTAFLMLMFIAYLAAIVAGCGEAGQQVYGNIAPGSPPDAAGKKSPPPPDSNTAVIADTVADVFREPDIKSERVTQAIFNQPVRLFEVKGEWTRVKVVDGYTGWVKSKFIDKDCTSINVQDYKNKVVITGKAKKIVSQPRGGLTLLEAPMGTELYSNFKRDGFYEVAMPGGITGWVEESGTMLLEPHASIPKTTSMDFIATLQKFKGTSYLWGGVSSLGIDCSGLTYIAGRVNGITLPRDAKDQFKLGMTVSQDGLKPGDFLFFNTKGKPDEISHVGVYLGDGQYINASSSKGYVTTASTSDEYYKTRLAGIRRFFD